MRRNQRRFSTVKVTLRINKEIDQRIREEASRRGVTQHSIIMTALKDRYDPDFQLEKDAMIAERLNRVDRQLRIVKESCIVIAESQSFFIRMWLTNNAEVPADLREKAVASARIRYEKYEKAVLKALGEISLKPWKDVREVTTSEEEFISASGTPQSDLRQVDTCSDRNQCEQEVENRTGGIYADSKS